MEEKPFVDLLNATAPPVKCRSNASSRPENPLATMGGNGRNGGVSLMAGRGGVGEARGWERFRPPAAGAVARITIRDLDGLYEDRSKSFNATKLDGCRLHLDAPPGISFFTPRDEWPREPPPQPKQAPRPREPPRASNAHKASRGTDNCTTNLGAGIASSTAPMAAAAAATNSNAAGGAASLSAPGASEGNAVEEASDDGMGDGAFLLPPPSLAAVAQQPEQTEVIPKTQERVAPKRTSQAAAVQRTRNVVPPPAGGYCECCATSYIGSMEVHCASAPHQAFMADSRNFEAFDALVASLRNSVGDNNSSNGPSLSSSAIPMTQQPSLAASPLKDVSVLTEHRNQLSSPLRESVHPPGDDVSRRAGLLKRPRQQPDERIIEPESTHETRQQELPVTSACQLSSPTREVPPRPASGTHHLQSPPHLLQSPAPAAAPPASGRHRPFVAPSTKLAAPRRLRSNSVTSPSTAATPSVASAPAISIRADPTAASDVAWNDQYSHEGCARAREDSFGADLSLALEDGVVEGRHGRSLTRAGSGRLSGRRVLHSRSGGGGAAALTQGQVEGKRPGKSCYRVVWDKGDSEDMSSEELEPLVVAAAAAEAEARSSKIGARSRNSTSTSSSNSNSSNSGPQAPPTVTFASAKDMLKAKSMNKGAFPGTAAATREETASSSVKTSQESLSSLSKTATTAVAAPDSSPATQRRQSLQRTAKDAPVACEVTSTADVPASSLTSSALAKNKPLLSTNSRRNSAQSAADVSRSIPTLVVPGRALKVLNNYANNTSSCS